MKYFRADIWKMKRSTTKADPEKICRYWIQLFGSKAKTDGMTCMSGDLISDVSFCSSLTPQDTNPFQKDANVRALSLHHRGSFKQPDEKSDAPAFSKDFRIVG